MDTCGLLNQFGRMDIKTENRKDHDTGLLNFLEPGMFIEVTEEWALRTALYAFSTGLFFLSL
jgi:hypothetical protein